MPLGERSDGIPRWSAFARISALASLRWAGTRHTRSPPEDAVVADQSTQTSTKDQAVAAASDVKDEAAGQAKAVGQEAKAGATAVAETAMEQAHEVGVQLQEQVRTVVGQATSELEHQLDDRLQRVAETARTQSRQLHALAEGRTDEAGAAADMVRTAAEQLGRIAERAQELGPKGVADEVASFARRRPLVFLASAAATGFVVGRIARNAGKATSDGNGASPSSTAGEPLAALPADTASAALGAPTVPGPMVDPVVVTAGRTGV
jgi:hypothetical protein